jgi:type I restriction enzyme R subunit
MVTVAVARERVQYLNAQGKLITESLRDYTRINLTRRFDSLDKLPAGLERRRPQGRADRGAGRAGRADRRAGRRSGPRPRPVRPAAACGLEHAAAHPARARPPRTKRNVFTQYGLVARKVLDALLDKYADEGMATIEADNVLSVQPFTELGSPAELMRSFGRPRPGRTCRPCTSLESAPRRLSGVKNSA